MTSIYKIMTLDMLHLNTANAEKAMRSVVNVVTSCRFGVTAPASEEVVLMKILQVLLACMKLEAWPVNMMPHQLEAWPVRHGEMKISAIRQFDAVWPVNEPIDIVNGVQHCSQSVPPLAHRIETSTSFLFMHYKHGHAQSRRGASYQQQEVAMEVLVDFCRQKTFMVEMYANFGCDIICCNVFEDLANLLSKSAFAINCPLSSMHILSLDGLIVVIFGMAARVGHASPVTEQAPLTLEEYAPFCYGDYIHTGWRNFLDCILRLHKLHLLPARVASDAADELETWPDALHGKPVAGSLCGSHMPAMATPRRSSGLMSGFQEPRSQPTEQQLTAHQRFRPFRSAYERYIV
ncbi:hypothetical protein ACLOJK_029720 [Asimina triloba]